MNKFLLISLLILAVPLVIAATPTSSITPTNPYNNETINAACSLPAGSEASAVINYTVYINGVPQSSGTNQEFYYQEFANVSDGNGSLSTGTYGTGNNFFYINYSKPSNAALDSQWQVKHGKEANATQGLYNITLDNYGCWNADPNTLQVRMYSKRTSGSTDASWPECYNGSNWLLAGKNFSFTQTGYPGGSADTSRLYDGDYTTPDYWGSSTSAWTYINPAGWDQWSFVWEEGAWWATGNGTNTTTTALAAQTAGTNITVECSVTNSTGMTYGSNTTVTVLAAPTPPQNACSTIAGSWSGGAGFLTAFIMAIVAGGIILFLSGESGLDFTSVNPESIGSAIMVVVGIMLFAVISIAMISLVAGGC